MTQTAHEALWWILTISGSTSKEELWRRKFLDFELYIVQRAVIKHLIADAQSRINGKVVDRPPLENEPSVLTTSAKSFTCSLSPVALKQEIVEEAEDPFRLFYPKRLHEDRYRR